MKLCKAFLALLMLPLLLFADCQVGPLNHDGMVVTDLEAAIAQWEAGTGNEFRDIHSIAYLVHFPGCEDAVVTLRSSFSKLNNPFIEFVEATPAIGPWAPAEDNGKAPGYLGYAVHCIKSVGHTLTKAGFELVARSGNSFAFYKGRNGVLVKLVREDLVPAGPEVNNPQAPIVFGSIDHTDVVVFDYEKVKSQLAHALSLIWAEPGFSFPASSFLYAGIGVVPTDIRFIPSVNLPSIYVEEGKPHLGPFAASPTTNSFRVVYNAPAGSVPTYVAQLVAAGFALNASFPSVGPIINAELTAPQGYWIEIQQPF